MDLMEKSAEIDRRLEELESAVEKDILNGYKALKSANERCSEAIKQGDLSENAEYEAALKDIGAIQGNIRILEEQLSAIKQSKQEIMSYIKVSSVSPYSTVHIRKVRENGKYSEPLKALKDEYVFKIFRGSLSRYDLGILSEYSDVGKSLIGKKEGDIIVVRHRLNRASATYEIVSFV